MSNVIIQPKTDVDYTSGGPSRLKLLEEVRARIRRLNYSIRTEDAYVDWVRRFVLFHGKRHRGTDPRSHVDGCPANYCPAN
jgi:hypothetical protein